MIFSQQQEKEKVSPCANCQKIHGLECVQYMLLDHSKTLVFGDVFKIEIPFKYSHACTIHTYSSYAKNTV